MSDLSPECAPKRTSAALNLWVHAIASLETSGHFQLSVRTTRYALDRTGSMATDLPDEANQFDFPDAGLLAQAFRRANRVRQNADFVRRFNVIWVVQSHQKKYSCCAVGQISATDSRVLTHKRGVSRSSRTLGAGCDGRVGGVRRTLPVAYGKVVWS
jgi:hypothetical protein